MSKQPKDGALTIALEDHIWYCRNVGCYRTVGPWEDATETVRTAEGHSFNYHYQTHNRRNWDAIYEKAAKLDGVI